MGMTVVSFMCMLRLVVVLVAVLVVVLVVVRVAMRRHLWARIVTTCPSDVGMQHYFVGSMHPVPANCFDNRPVHSILLDNTLAALRIRDYTHKTLVAV